MKFCTAINCMDGRTQIPVNSYLKKRFKAKYVDTITEAGPNLILAKAKDHQTIKSIFKRIDISIKKHNSVGIALVGHYDCAANKAKKSDQIKHIKKSIAFLKSRYKNIKIIGLWADNKFKIKEI